MSSPISGRRGRQDLYNQGMDYLLHPLPPGIAAAEERGDFRLALGLVRRRLAANPSPELAARLRFEPERLARLRLAYPHDRAAALRLLKKRLRGFRKEELDGWIRDGHAAPRLIDGKERFEASFASNIIFCDPRLKRRDLAADPAAEESLGKAMARIDELLAGAPPARYRVRARIALTLKRRPAGTVRCWLPFPRVGDQVSSARLLAASHKNYRLAPPYAGQRTVYFEAKSREFFAEFEYEVSEWLTGGEGDDRVPAAVRKYLAEEAPHIVFTPQVRALAARLTAGGKTIYSKARRIYDWLTRNFTYNFTLPYGVYGNITEHALAGLKGDCGFQALAFITLCRAAGVPARWQSGWAIRPGRAGLHDWALFYAGGWRPADVSFGTSRHRAGEEARRRFYFGNLDAGRMVANSEFGAPLLPAKRHWRSDPSDNQAGEAETASGNLYYDELSHKITLLSHERLPGRG